MQATSALWVGAAELRGIVLKVYLLFLYNYSSLFIVLYLFYIRAMHRLFLNMTIENLTIEFYLY